MVRFVRLREALISTEEEEEGEEEELQLWERERC